MLIFLLSITKSNSPKVMVSREVGWEAAESVSCPLCRSARLGQAPAWAW